MADWAALAAELDAWDGIPGGATFWWRDDDLRAPGPRIRRLLALSAGFAAPVLLAAVPAALDAAVADMLADFPLARVAQHGFAHVDHALPGPGRVRKIELGGDRPMAALRTDLAAGWARLSGVLADRLLPVMVPPWNRIDPAVTAVLPQWGYRGLSGFGPRTATAGLVSVNTHIDPIAWRGDRGFAGEAAVLGQALAHLAARREGTVDPAEPTGLLTHHADHDPATWAFLAGFLEAVAGHPHARLLAPQALFPA
ncbi:MAG: hypothetical protein R3F55_12470 [Alphaproteobacteria bacterium]